MPGEFLRAEWRKLVMANYSVDPKILAPYVPHKTELDLWNDRCYVSLVGFMFLNTRLKGIKVPFHTNFEEVNLRFYVRHQAVDGWRRGVVFIREIVPKPALTFVANTVYGEKYVTLPMKHSWDSRPDEMRVEYEWKKPEWNSFTVYTSTQLEEIQSGSEEEFITEHYWGYTQLSSGNTSEYQVEHPRWQVYPVKRFAIDVNFKDVYGDNFAFLTKEKPVSVFLAEGSEIKVNAGRKIP